MSINQIQAECDCPPSYYPKCQKAGRCLLEVAIGMIDDPHDATWVPHPTKKDFCVRCQEEMEFCNCYRGEDSVLVTMAWCILWVLGFVVAGLLIYAFAVS